MRNYYLIVFAFLLLTGCENKTSDNSNKSNTETSSATEIYFQVKTDNADDLEVFEDGIIPWISIKEPDKEIENLLGKDDIVLKCDSAVLLIDYPLNNPVEIIIKPLTKQGFTKKELILAISKEYHKIYNDEEETTKTKTIPLNEREGLINRNQTDGIYGIYGHDIDDLDLSAIIIHTNQNGIIKLELAVES